MKTNLLVIIILCLSLGLKSQNYHPFPQENAIWHSIGSNLFYDGMYSQQYILQGDTIINDETWSKIYFNNIYFETRNNLIYLAAIRENEYKQILVKIPGIPEFILYDFSLEIGDTIWYEHSAFGIVGSNNPISFEMGYNHNHYKVVVEKDSVLLENEQFRNRIILNSFSEHNGYLNTHEDNHWVEGFGCIRWSGLFHPIVIGRAVNGDHIAFVCFKQDDEVLYLNNPYCDDCLCETFTSLDHFDVTDQILTVYPNPGKGYITININLDFTANASLLITDLSGKKLFEKQVPGKEELSLDLSPYRSGVVIIQLFNRKTNKILTAKKIIIQ